MAEITIKEVLPNDQELIHLISKWYLDEWAIPCEDIHHRMSIPSAEDLVFHLIVYEEEMPVATGGLYWKVGLFNAYPEYKKFGPWVALLYVIPGKRGQGIGRILLKEIEKHSAHLGYKKIYLFTNSAEALYQREGWKTTYGMIYKKKNTVVMDKVLHPEYE